MRPPLPRRAAAWAIAAAWPLAAVAQDAALQSITITAQKREQSAQAAGLAVTVLSGDELAARGVRRVNGLADEVPNLEIEPAFGGSQAQFRLRGVGFQDYATNNAGAVTVYVDEVALPLPVQTQGLLFDLDRVEVLRGPQGTLYGRNTTGGAVNFITRKPTARFEGTATVGAGSYGAWEAEGFVSGPLGGGVRGRVALATQQGGGWQRRREDGATLGDRNVTGGRGQLEIDAAPGLRLNLEVHAGKDQSEGQGLYVFTAQPAVPGYPVPKAATPADTDTRNTGWGFSPTFLAAIGEAADAKPSRDNTSAGTSATLRWDFADLQLVSLTAFDRFRRRELADYDAQTLPLAETFFASKSRNVSQEVRVGTRDGQRTLGWLAGVYAADEKLDEAYWSSFANSFGFPVVRTSYVQKVRTTSGFGQLDWRFASDWKLVAGLRQEYERRERENFVTESLAPAIPFTGPTSGRFGNHHTSGKLGVEAQFSPATLGYASVSRGVKSGGFTAYNTFNELALTPFKPEVLVAWEAGLKTEPTKQLRLNAAVFHYDYRNQQILDAIKDPTTGATIGTITNAPRSTIDGVELEAAWKASAALTLSAFAGWKEGHFKEYVALSPPANLAGQSLYFPRTNAGAAADWRLDAGGYALLLHGDASYRSRSTSFLNRINPGYDFDIPGYTLANARIELSPPSGAWTASLAVRNLFDRRYDVTRNFFDLPLPVAAAGAPRTWLVSVRHDFR